MDDTTPVEHDDLRVTVRADDVEAARLWQLLATASEWPRWAPHIRRVTRSSPDDGLRVGERLRIDGYGPLHVTPVITRVEAPTRWDFRVDLPLGHRVTSVHEVLSSPTAVRVRMALDGGPLPTQIGGLLIRAYRPVAQLALRRLVALGRGHRSPGGVPTTGANG